MIIQAISLSDQLDKDLNTFFMRVREWYGWHFPELYKLVPDAHQYARLAVLIGDRTTLSEDSLEEMQEILDDDETRAKNVLDAARASMGSDISEVDLINISNFAERVVKLAEYRKNLRRYLTEKMNVVAPNLSALIGETIAARLISHAYVPFSSIETKINCLLTTTLAVLSLTWPSTPLLLSKSSVPKRPFSELSRQRVTPPSTVSSTTLLSLAVLVLSTRAEFLDSLPTNVLLLVVLTVSPTFPPTNLERLCVHRLKSV